MYFEPIRKIVEQVNELNNDRLMSLLFKVYGKEITDEIIYLNTDIQLFQKGIDSNSISLEEIGGGYAEFTVIDKQEKGLPFDRITLFDTGDFYESFDVRVEKDGFVIIADTIKNDGTFSVDLTDRWGDDILGLTEKSLTDLSNFLIELINDFLAPYLIEKAKV